MAKGKVLVVEDDEDLVHMLTYNLGKRGYQTAEALDGMAACQRIESEEPDLILLDILLPGVDGWQLCKIIRGHEQEKITVSACLSDQTEVFLSNHSLAMVSKLLAAVSCKKIPSESTVCQEMLREDVGKIKPLAMSI